MIKHTITYEDFNGGQVTEDLYFHLSKNELINMVSEDQDIVRKLTEIGNSQDGARIVAFFKDFLGKGYGVKSEDGRRFTKSPEQVADFLASPAFDQLLTEVMADTGLAVKLVNGMMPADLAKIVAKQMEVSGGTIPDPNNLDTGAGTWPRNDPPAELTTKLPDGTMRIHLSPAHKDYYEKSGLREPYDEQGERLPWSLREPTEKETMTMSHAQLQDTFRRKASGWTPPA